MIQVSNGLGDIDNFLFRRKSLSLPIGHEPIILSNLAENDFRYGSHIMKLGTANVVYLAGLEVIDHIRKCIANIGDVCRSSPVAEIHRVGLVMERVVTEDADGASVWTVVFARSVGIEQAYANGLRRK